MKSLIEQIATENAVLVNFYTTWCGTCNVLKPELEKFAEETNFPYPIVDVDLGRDSQIITQFQIKSMPTLIFFKNGKEIWRNVGMINAQQLTSEINNN